ncbi:MAG: stalk domain-containing protein [Vulcanimicrobiaceae bacterium]
MALALLLGVSTAAFAHPAATTPVEYLGARLGYSVIESHAAGTVTLKRPGAVVILRPGTYLYTVNGRPEVASTPPEARNGLVYVDARLAAELGRIAAATASRTAAPLTRLAPITAVGKLSLVVGAVPGQTQIRISGTGPTGATVSITLLGEISADLPTVELSRHEVVIGSDGTFTLTSSTAPLYTAGTRVVVDARAGVGVVPATASIVLGRPNPTVVSPVDTLSSGQ